MPTKTAQNISSLLSTFFHTAIGTKRDDQLADDFRKSWRRRISGLMLLIMYALVFYIVIMSLTAYQIQNRVRALSEIGERQSIWSVARLADQIVTMEGRIREFDIVISGLKTDLFAVGKDEYEAELSLDKIGRKLVILISATGAIMPDPDGDFIFDDLLNIARPIGLTDENFRNKVSEIADAYNLAYELFESVGREKRLIEVRLEELNAESQKFNKQNGLKNNSNIVDLIDELRFFHRSTKPGEDGIISGLWKFLIGSSEDAGNSRSIYSFVTLPSEVLILLVVIAMGTMGSLISISQVFFSGEDRSITFYLFRPLFGAVVAIGVYVVTKAGVIVASNLPAQADGSAKLNAFFVSFISLVGGMMSESAIEMFKRAGANFLRGDPVMEHARYASGVAATMANQKKEPKDLLPFLDVQPEIVAKWLEQNEKVPGGAQRIIAAWLKQPVRNLFSDLPPNKSDVVGNV